MPLPLIPIAISLASKFLPSLLGRLFGKKAESTASAVVDIATAITGESQPSKLEAALQANPAALLKFQEAANSFTLQLEREDTKRLEAVNITMQAEARSNSWMQRSWRPFNGFLLGFSIWCDYFLLPILLAAFNSTLALEHLPMQVYMVWSTVLGISAWTRGQEKIKKAENPTEKPLGNILDLLT